jgi:hypothetical protein
LNTSRVIDKGFAHSTVTEVKPEQRSKAQDPKLVTDLGIITEVKLVQPVNVNLSITVIELGIETEVKLVQ